LYQSCLGWQHHSTVLAHSRLWSTINFFLSILTILIIPSWWKTSMQKLLTSWWTWSLVTALLLKQSYAVVSCNFLVKRYHQEMPSNSLPAFHMIYGMALQMMKMKRCWGKRSFLNSFHVVKNAEGIFLTFKWQRSSCLWLKELQASWNS